jgi:uncharacterized membrane protein YqhA
MKTVLEKSPYLAIVGVISLLIAAIAAFAWGAMQTVNVVSLVIASLGQDSSIIVEFVVVIDTFLVAITILIFALSLHELFVSDIDVPDWMIAHDLYELKTKLSSMLILVMSVKFFEKFLEVKDALELLELGLAISVVSAVLIAFGYFGKKD